MTYVINKCNILPIGGAGLVCEVSAASNNLQNVGLIQKAQ
jgi:hypothetical protein